VNASDSPESPPKTESSIMESSMITVDYMLVRHSLWNERKLKYSNKTSGNYPVVMQIRSKSALQERLNIYCWCCYGRSK